MLKGFPQLVDSPVSFPSAPPFVPARSGSTIFGLVVRSFSLRRGVSSSWSWHDVSWLSVGWRWLLAFCTLLLHESLGINSYCFLRPAFTWLSFFGLSFEAPCLCNTSCCVGLVRWLIRACRRVSPCLVFFLFPRLFLLAWIALKFFAVARHRLKWGCFSTTILGRKVASAFAVFLSPSQ